MRFGLRLTEFFAAIEASDCEVLVAQVKIMSCKIKPHVNLRQENR